MLQPPARLPVVAAAYRQTAGLCTQRTGPAAPTAALRAAPADHTPHSPVCHIVRVCAATVSRVRAPVCAFPIRCLVSVRVCVRVSLRAVAVPVAPAGLPVTLFIASTDPGRYHSLRSDGYTTVDCALVHSVYFCINCSA